VHYLERIRPMVHAGVVILLLVLPALWPFSVLAETEGSGTERVIELVAAVAAEASGPAPAIGSDTSSDEYGNVTEEEEKAAPAVSGIADPIEPWNRAMYQFNDKFYFWLWKPMTEGYKYVVPEDFRVLFSNLFKNIKAPVRIINNLLQGKFGYAGKELASFLINSTIGVGGLRDCSGECFGIKGRDTGFGQTLASYGVGSGFYIVWPILGPSSPRDTVGFVADRFLTPTAYLSPGQVGMETAVGLYVWGGVNRTSFHLEDYEILKKAAIDPYIAIRDGYVQYGTGELAK
jgi:phospholipid-binding lipoprotein MlaA